MSFSGKGLGIIFSIHRITTRERGNNEGSENVESNFEPHRRGVLVGSVSELNMMDYEGCARFLDSLLNAVLSRSPDVTYGQ